MHRTALAPPGIAPGGVTGHGTAGAATDLGGQEPAHPRPSRWPWALVGIAAGAAGLGVGELIAGLVAPSGSAVTAVSEAILRILPGPLVNVGKETLGHADKPVLQLLVLAGALALAACAGLLTGAGVSLPRVGRGIAVLSGLAVIAAVAALSAPDRTLGDVVPLLAGWVASLIVLGRLASRVPVAGARAVADPMPRRRFLGVLGAIGGASVVAATGGRALGSRSVQQTTFALPSPTVTAPAVPSGANLKVAGISPYVTPSDAFYRIDTALIVPRLQVSDWHLEISGMVRHPITLTMADVLARPLEEHFVTLACVSNPVGGDLVGNAKWLGVRLNQLLAEAGPLAGADMVLSASDDGFSAGTPLSIMTDPDRACLLAIGMNGAPLPRQHGFPARLVVPGLYGYVSATKWVTKIKVTTFAADEGYWTPLGWSAQGPVKLASRIDTPRKAQDAGTVMVGGVAWCQHTGISRVQLRVDDADWVDAELADTVGPDTWRLWRYAWDGTPGEHRLSVRATDANGVVQDERVQGVLPDGATGLHTITVQVH